MKAECHKVKIIVTTKIYTQMPFITLRKFPSIPTLLGVFIMKCYWIFIINFASTEVIIWFGVYILLIRYITIIDFWILNNFRLLGLSHLVMMYNSFYMLLIWFTNSLLGIFAYISQKDGFVCSFFWYLCLVLVIETHELGSASASWFLCVH